MISDTEADIGSNLRWACAAAGKPRPMVRWLRNGEPLASQVGNWGSLPHDHPLLLAWPSYWLGQPGDLGMFCCFFSSQSCGHRCVTCAAPQTSGIPPNGGVILNLAPRRPKILRRPALMNPQPDAGLQPLHHPSCPFCPPNSPDLPALPWFFCTEPSGGLGWGPAIL